MVEAAAIILMGSPFVVNYPSTGQGTHQFLGNTLHMAVNGLAVGRDLDVA